MFEREYTFTSDAVRNFMYKVYGWMSVALATTAGVAYWVASTPAVFKVVLSSPILFFGLALLQIGLVTYLTWRIGTMNYSTALVSFLTYAAASGITFSVYFYVYTLASIYLAFAITAGTFLAMAVYGYFTKADLSALENYLVMGLFGVAISIFVNIWFRSPEADYYISLFAVALFTVLTAYDVQKIKHMAHAPMLDQSERDKVALMGALTLYLDFINLFIHLLRLFGKRRD